MKIAGIIAEYNPFHRGHAYQCDVLRGMGYEGIVAVMSGNFVQRADVALTDKYRRARGAVASGVDLVLELPLPYAVAAAEDFGAGGVALLDATGVISSLCCGCESGDETNRRQYEGLKKAEETGTVKEKMREGLSYPAACKNAVTSLGYPWSEKPNDVLALSYRKALDRIVPEIPLLTILRKGDYHSGGEGFESAEQIRQKITAGEDVTQSLPQGSYAQIKDAPLGDLKRLERGILAYYRTATPEELKQYYGMREGLPERICKFASAPDLETLYQKVKTKRFPHSAVRRAVLCGYLQIPASLPEISYLRVLAFNETGQKILKEMKKTAKLPVLSALTPQWEEASLAKIQLRGDEIFAVTLPEPGKPKKDFTERAKKVCQI